MLILGDAYPQKRLVKLIKYAKFAFRSRVAHVFLGPESAQDENSWFFPMFLLKNSTKSQFYPGFPRFFPQALLCGFSKLQLQTQATAQVGKSHCGRSGRDGRAFANTRRAAPRPAPDRGDPKLGLCDHFPPSFARRSLHQVSC